MKRIILIILLCFLCFGNTLYGQNKFWIGTNSTLWSDPLNWSATSGGAGGAGAPIATDVVTFDDQSSQPCTIDITPVGIDELNLATNYTGTITIDQNTSITVTGDINLQGGTLTLANSGVTRNYLISSGTGNFTISNNAGITIGDDTDASIVVFNGTAFLNDGVITGSASSDVSVNANIVNLSGIDASANLSIIATNLNTLDNNTVFNQNLDLIIADGNGVTLAGPVTFDGPETNITISANDLSFGGFNSFGNLDGSSEIAITNNGGTFSLTGSNFFFGNITMTNDGTATNINGSNIYDAQVEVINESGITTFTGGNIFSDSVFVNSNGGNVILGNTDGSVYDDDVILIADQGGQINMAFGGIGTNSFNGNIYIASNSNPATNTAIAFGANGGSTTITSSYTILERPMGLPGVDGWQNGNLSIQNLTHEAGVDLDFTFRAPTTYNISLVGNTFENPTTVPELNALQNNNFTNTATLSTSISNAVWEGGNTFSGNTTITYEGTTTLTTGNSTGDNFVGNATLDILGAGNLFVGNTQYTQFRRNLAINDANITFGDIAFTGTATQEISATVTEMSVRNLQLNKADSSVNINDLDLRIRSNGNGNFQDGFIRFFDNSPRNIVIFEDNTTSTINEGYVDGIVRKIGLQDFVFPTGNDSRIGLFGIENLTGGLSTDFIEVEYQFSSARNIGGINATSAIASDLTRVSDLEYWEVSRSGTVQPQVRLLWEDRRGSGITDNDDLVEANWDGTAWQRVDASVPGATLFGRQYLLSDVAQNTFPNFTVPRANINEDFLYWTFASVAGLNPLPVTLRNFEAELQANRQVAILWETSFEENLSHFELERSTSDFQTFEKISQLDARGNSTTLRKYNFMDALPPEASGEVYYRLKSVNFDGSFTYSTIEVISVDGELSVKVFPNPSQDMIQVESPYFHAVYNTSLLFMDARGKILQRYTNLEESRLEMNIQDLPAGIYFLQMTSQGIPSQTHRIIKY